ncbi:3-isopropylmalate dehydratase small subunit, partial [Staphylococcus haemolyticus]
FNVQIEETWKHKLVNGLDDIDITLEYEDLIEQYENKNKG